MTENPFVEFMRTYGPCASSDSMYDEHVHAAVQKYGVAPIELPAPHVEEIGKILTSAEPTNVILTGTAGDGKTYHIRRILMEHLGGEKYDWPGEELVIKASLPSGRELRIIRDLSELGEDSKAKEIAHITKSVLGSDARTVYIIAANDGQLLEMWRNATETHPENPELSEVHQTLLTMLQSEAQRDPAGQPNVRIYNLSRTTRPAIVDNVIDNLLGHPAWNTGCKSCPLSKNTWQCPIRSNRHLLLGLNRDTKSSTFRSRLRAALEIAAANDNHIPIRQILSLVVNIVLGHTGNSDDPLLSCRTVQESATSGCHTKTNPYDNVVGANLPPDVRRRHTVFSTLDGLGLGYETTNEFDDLLLQQKPKSVVMDLEESDPVYGDPVFQGTRIMYMNSPKEPMQPRQLTTDLISQRRRLFFQVMLQPNEFESSHWNLTVFHHAQEYLDYRKAIRDGKPLVLIDKIERELVKGLNRVLTGMMTDDTEKLWLATAIGSSNDSMSHILTTSEIGRTGGGQLIHLQFTYNEFRDWPEMKFETPFNIDALKWAPSFEIRPQIFEYLIRVSAGYLPSSFARQCHQEIRHFATVMRQIVQEIFESSPSPTTNTRILSLDEDGLMKASPIKEVV